MVNRRVLSNILFFISSVLLLYAYWFEVRLSLELMALAWAFLAVSRTIIMFPNLKGKSAELKLGKEIK